MTHVEINASLFNSTMEQARLQRLQGEGYFFLAITKLQKGLRKLVVVDNILSYD